MPFVAALIILYGKDAKMSVNTIVRKHNIEQNKFPSAASRWLYSCMLQGLCVHRNASSFLPN